MVSEVRRCEVKCVVMCELWCGLVWCDLVWCGVVWCGVVWCGVARCGVRWYEVKCVVMCCDIYVVVVLCIQNPK